MFVTGEKKWDQDINTVGGLKDVVLYESCYSNAPSANAQQGKISSGINHYVFSPPLMDITLDVPHESGYLSSRVSVDYNNKIQQMIDIGKNNNTLSEVNEKPILEGKSEESALQDKVASAIVNPAKSIENFSSIPGLVDSHFIHESYEQGDIKTVAPPKSFKYVHTESNTNIFAKNKRTVKKYYAKEGALLVLDKNIFFINKSGKIVKYISLPKLEKQPPVFAPLLPTITGINSKKISEIVTNYLNKGTLPTKEKFEADDEDECPCKKLSAGNSQKSNTQVIVLVIVIILVFSTCVVYNDKIQSFRESFMRFLNSSSSNWSAPSYTPSSYTLPSTGTPTMPILTGGYDEALF
jgi:hypothetical protein